MGEVYCALDTNLARQVAIKVLQDMFGQDPTISSWPYPFRSGLTRGELQFGAPVPLFQTYLTGNMQDRQHYHVSRDDCFLVDTLQEVTSPLTVLLNWKPGAASAEPR